MASKTNVVTWDSQGPDDIIYACEHDDLRTLTSVTVPEHAVAIFVRDGQLTGVLEPGRHLITSSNIPWLTKLYNLALGYKETPFKVQIIFVSQKMFNGKWGIRGMIKAAPGYEVPITLMANGDYQFRINDIPVFYTQVLGGLQNYTTGDLNAFMRGFINEQVTQQLTQQFYMDVLNNLEKASTTTKVMVEQYFQQRGIELLSLKIAEVRTTEEDQQKVFEFLQFNSANGEAFRRYEIMESMANAIGTRAGAAGAAVAHHDVPVLRQPEPLSLQVLQQLRQTLAPDADAAGCGPPGTAPAGGSAAGCGPGRTGRGAEIQQLPVLRPEHIGPSQDPQVLPLLLRAALLNHLTRPPGREPFSERIRCKRMGGRLDRAVAHHPSSISLALAYFLRQCSLFFSETSARALRDSFALCSTSAIFTALAMGLPFRAVTYSS